MIEQNNEMSFKDLLILLHVKYKFLLSKWKIIVLFGLLGGALGLTYAFLKPIQYESKITFILEDTSKNKPTGLASLASSFGVGVETGGGLFSGQNFLIFLTSRNLVEKTLLEPFDKKTTFAQKYIEINEWDKNWQESDDEDLKSIKYKIGEDRGSFSLLKDSILGVIYLDIFETKLLAEQPNLENSIMELTITTRGELFSKKFSEKLLDVATEYYIENKTKKAKQNVLVLEKQIDSIRTELFSSMTQAASANDQVYGLNPAMNVQRVPYTKKQVDIQANSIILNELVKNLEIAKMNLLNETPLFQVIDNPILPLFQVKVSKLISLILGGFLFGFMVCMYLLINNYFKSILSEKHQ